MGWPLDYVTGGHRMRKKNNLLLHMAQFPLPSWITVPGGAVEAMNGTREQHPYILYTGFSYNMGTPMHWLSH